MRSEYPRTVEADVDQHAQDRRAIDDHPHTIDRWDDATGENLIEQIAAVGDYLVALGDVPGGGEALARDKITLRNRARVLEKSWGD